MERLAAGTDKEEGVAEAEGRDSQVSGSGHGTSKHAPQASRANAAAAAQQEQVQSSVE